MERFKHITEAIRSKREELRSSENIAGVESWSLEGFLEFLEGTEEQHARINQATIKNAWSGYVALTAAGAFEPADEKAYGDLGKYILELQQKQK